MLLTARSLLPSRFSSSEFFSQLGDVTAVGGGGGGADGVESKKETKSGGEEKSHGQPQQRDGGDEGGAPSPQEAACADGGEDGQGHQTSDVHEEDLLGSRSPLNKKGVDERLQGDEQEAKQVIKPLCSSQEGPMDWGMSLSDMFSASTVCVYICGHVPSACSVYFKMIVVFCYWQYN